MSGKVGDNQFKASGVVASSATDYDDDKLQSNIALLGFKVAVNGSLAKYNLQDQTIDEYEDTSGVDAAASTDEVRAGGAGAYYYSGYVSGTPTGGTTGDYTHDGTTYYFHKFTTDSNFITGGTGTGDIFLIGGGGGAAGDNCGGGGAGGLIWKPAHTFAGSTTFAVDIGDGGPGASGDPTGCQGEDTTFASTTFVAKGGGYAGNQQNDGGDGGCAGGAGRIYSPGNSQPGSETQTGQAGDSGTYGFGNDGGAGHSHGNNGPGGGGGGTGAVGVDAANGTVGNGGAGLSDFVNSSATETTAFLLATTSGTDSSNVATDASSTGTLYIGGGGSGGTQLRGSHPGGGVGGVGGGNDINPVASVTDALTNTGSGGGSNDSNGGFGGGGGSGLLIIRYADGDFADTYNDMTLQSTDTTASTEADNADMVTLIENAAGTATINTDIKGYVSRDSGTTFTQGTLVDEGTWGTNKKILAFHDLDISAQSGTSMCYKITTHNQSVSKITNIHATSIGWKA